MRVVREALLKSLDAVQAGLASRETEAQSTCFVFRGGRVMTYNDEIACAIACPLDIQGAVPAKNLLALLAKLSEPELDIDVENEQLIIKGKGKKTNIRLEAEILLPVENVEIPPDDAWHDLVPTFCEALGTALQCASTDMAGEFKRTCVNLTPTALQACDNFQLINYPLETGLQTACLVRATSARQVVALGVNALAETPGWLHFRSPIGLILSCRRWLEAYDDLSGLLKPEGDKVTIPAGIGDSVARAEIFSSENAAGNNVEVSLRPGRLRIRGIGASGSHEEQQQVQYDGPPLTFLIAPKLLASLTSRAPDCQVTTGRLYIDAGRFLYVACLIVPRNTPAAEAAA